MLPFPLDVSLMMFFIYGFIGWVVEVIYYGITEGKFINRGFLNGALCPVYGIGFYCVIWFFRPFMDSFPLRFFGSAIVCTTVELIAGALLYAIFHLRWWDYSGYFLNLNGRICCEGLAVFAVGGMIAVYLLVPLLDLMMERISTKVLIPVCAVLAFCFFGDLGYSRRVPNMGEGITESGPAQAALAEAEPAGYPERTAPENG